MHLIPLHAGGDNPKVELQRKRPARGAGVHALACPMSQGQAGAEPYSENLAPPRRAIPALAQSRSSFRLKSLTLLRACPRNLFFQNFVANFVVNFVGFRPFSTKIPGTRSWDRL